LAVFLRLVSEAIILD